MTLKRYPLTAVFALVVCAALICGVPARAEDTSPDAMATLYAVFHDDPADAEGVHQYELGYTGDLTVEMLAQGLSDLTGLHFAVNGAQPMASGITIDWSADSTLVAGLGEREQKEEFFFYDVDSLSWFMMDSLARTVSENMMVDMVFFTMDGGQPLSLPGVSGSPVFSAEEPYMGSAYYLAQAE